MFPQTLMLLAALFLSELGGSAQAHAKGWFSSTCDLLLGRPQEAVDETTLRHVLSQVDHEARIVNGYWNKKFVAEKQGLAEVRGEPLSVTVDYESAARSAKRSSLKIRLMIHPKFISGNWETEKLQLKYRAAAFIYFEDRTVSIKDGQKLMLSQIMLAEIEKINQKNEEFTETAQMMAAQDFPDLKFKTTNPSVKLMWIENELKTFQMVRSLLLAMQEGIKAGD